MIGTGIGYLGPGIGFFIKSKNKATALVWTMLAVIVPSVWFTVGQPLLQQFVADKVKVERILPPQPDSLRGLRGQVEESRVAGILISPEASTGNVARSPGNPGGVPIIVGGVDYSREYGYFADTNFQSWKLSGLSAILIYNRKTGDAFKIEAPVLEERIQEQMKK